MIRASRTLFPTPSFLLCSLPIHQRPIPTGVSASSQSDHPCARSHVVMILYPSKLIYIYKYMNLLVTIVVVSRLVYRKGIDLLVAAAPHICRRFPDVRFVIGTTFSILIPSTHWTYFLIFNPLLPYLGCLYLSGGDGPKMVELEQMREKHLLQDRIELIGNVPPGSVHSVSRRLTLPPPPPSPFSVRTAPGTDLQTSVVLFSLSLVHRRYSCEAKSFSTPL